MNNTELTKDGLKKVYLIKSAGYEFAEIELSDNTLLLGESGVGKTTLMRAVLFFYTMDYSDSALNINPDTKKSFNQWYFREHNSHIVYEYTKGKSKFLFVVSRGVKLHYTFIDITNSSLGVKELFLDGNMPVNLAKLNENIQTNNLPNYETTQKDRYINIFHDRDSDNKKIKHDSKTNFALFESINSSKEFAKTLSNIFASSKVSSNSLKRTIVSLIEDSNAKINLNNIKVDLNNFISEKKKIERFEKKIPTIEKLSDTHNSYKESKKEFKQKANILEKLKQDSTIKIEESLVKLAELESKKEKLNIAFKVSSEIFNEKISTKEKNISIESNQIDELVNKQKEYQSNNIDELVKEHHNEKTYQSSLTNLTQRFDALTSGSENIKIKYHKLQEQLNVDSNDKILDIKTKLHESIATINAQINEEIQTKEQKIAESSQKYIDNKVTLESKLESSKNTLNDIKVSIAKVEHFPFNKQNIDSYEDELKKFHQELLQTKQLITNNSHEITKVEDELKNIELKLKDSTLKLDEKILKEKDSLFEQKQMIEKKLDFESENLYGFLNKNNIKNKEKITTYLKDEILFSNKKFDIKQIVHDSAIFGLEITYEDEFKNEYQSTKLLEQLRVIKERVKELNKKAQSEKKKLENEAQLETKEKNRQRGVLYAKKSELQINEQSYTKSIEVAEENLKDTKESAKKQKKEELDKLLKQYAIDELNIKNLTAEILSITNKIQTITNTITNSSLATISALEKQITELHISEKAKIEKVKAKYKDDFKLIQDELDGILKDEGIDEKLLQNLKIEMENLKLNLYKINKNKNYVIVYISEYQQKIKNIAKKIENLKAQQLLRDELKNEFKSLKNNYKDEIQKMELDKKELSKIKSNLDNFLKKYNEHIENQDIQKAIKRSVTLNSSISTYEIGIENIVDNINSLYLKIKADEEKIKAFVLECLQVLSYDNIFKIEIEKDYIDSHSYLKTAKELISYVKDDKITLYKDISSDGFKTTLNSIRKELSIFEDAILDVESEIINLRNTINKAVDSFVVIDSIKIRFENSNNQILNSLKILSDFYDDNNDKFLSGLFTNDDSTTQKTKNELSSKISDLVDLLKTSKEYIELEDGFVLEFKVTEKGNDLKWRQTLNDIGSNGTSTLVKSIINISMLQMVSKNIVKNSEILSHCILDEIGTISTDYFKELKDFVNRSGFVFLNGMPIEDDMLISMYPTIYVGQNQGNYSRMILASKMDI